MAFDLLCADFNSIPGDNHLWEGNMADEGTKKSEFVAAKRANGLQFSAPEVETIFASQHKNVEAMMQANRTVLDGIQAIWRRQLDFIQEAVEGLTPFFGDFVLPPSFVNEKFAMSAEYSKRGIEKSFANARELTGLATKATTDAVNTINQRFREGLSEMAGAREKRNGETTT
jgi:phasin family protein